MWCSLGREKNKQKEKTQNFEKNDQKNQITVKSMFLAQTVSLNKIPRAFLKAQGSGSVFIVAPTLARWQKCYIFQPCYHHVCSFILLFVFLCLLQHWFLSWGRKVSMEGSSTRKLFRWLSTWGSPDTKAACTQPPSSSPLPPCCISHYFQS